MRVLFLGDGLQAVVTAALLASVGNRVSLFGKKELWLSFGSEPGLGILLDEQKASGRLKIVQKFGQDESFDFIFLSNRTVAWLVSELQDELAKSLEQGAIFVLLTPSEIGESIEATQRLAAVSPQSSVCCLSMLLREGRAIQDFSRPTSIIIGCDKDSAIDEVKSLFYPFNRVKDVMRFVTSKEAEFSSFAGSAMLATRLSFINEMAALAERCQVDIEVVRECIGSDPRIGVDYLYPGCGYGGTTLEENVRKIANALKWRSDDLGLLEVVAEINRRQKDLLFRKIWQFYQGQLSTKTIAVWGAAFKPGTPSLKGAPAIQLINALVAQGANVRIYDPMAKHELAQLFENTSQCEVTESADEAIINADILAICTEWKEFWSPDFAELSCKLKDQAIFDGRNLYQPGKVKAFGLKYYAIGRGDSLVGDEKTADK